MCIILGLYFTFLVVFSKFKVSLSDDKNTLGGTVRILKLGRFTCIVGRDLDVLFHSTLSLVP